MLVLVDGADAVLPGELVLQFKRNHGDTVDGQHHVDGIGVGRGVAELPGATQNIGFVALCIQGIQVGLRLEIADLQLAAHVLDAVAQDVQQTLIGDGGLQPVVQLVRRSSPVIFGVLGPFFWLGFGDELAEHIHIDALGKIVLTVMYPVALGILPTELGVAPGRGDQEGFNIPLEPLFAFVHDITPLSLLFATFLAMVCVKISDFHPISRDILNK